MSILCDSNGRAEPPHSAICIMQKSEIKRMRTHVAGSLLWKLVSMTNRRHIVKLTMSLPSCLPSYNYTAWAFFFFSCKESTLRQFCVFEFKLYQHFFFQCICWRNKKGHFLLVKVGAFIIATQRIMHNYTDIFFPQGKCLIALIFFLFVSEEENKDCTNKFL